MRRHAASFTPRWFGALWRTVGLVALVAIAFAVRRDAELTVWVAVAGIVATIAVPVFGIRRARPARLEIDEHGLSFEGIRRLDAPLVAKRIDRAAHVDVRITGRGGTVDVHSVSANDADAIVREANPSETVVHESYPANGEVYNAAEALSVMGALVAVVAIALRLPLVAPLVLGALAVLGGVLVRRLDQQRTVVRIDRDAITVRSESGERSFPIAAVESCELSLDGKRVVGVRLVMRLGPPEDVPFPFIPGGNGGGWVELARDLKIAIDARLEAARPRVAELPSPPIGNLAESGDAGEPLTRTQKS